MFSKKRLFTLIALVTLLTLLPSAALAASFTILGVTVTLPDSYTSCTPSDSISFSNITATGSTVVYEFNKSSDGTNWTKVGSGTLTADTSMPFPYPSTITGTMRFNVGIFVTNSQGTAIPGQKPWDITCSSTPPPPPPPPPPPGGEGCTPGYWRNHLEDWPPTGFAPSMNFDTVFGTNYFTPDITLNQAIWLGGGGIKKIARHGTAALLSAAHPDVNYPYSVAEVIAFVQAGDVDPLVDANELGCSIP